MNPATSAQELREARLAIGLSQGRVARDTGISRTHLSLFEGRKFLLDRGTLAGLRSYYAKHGYRFDDAAPGPRVLNPIGPRSDGDPSDVDVLDGFAVARGIDKTRAEAWLNQIAANDAVIDQLLETPTATHAWSGDPKVELRDEALLQMARNYALVRRLHGQELLPSPRSRGDKPQLTGDLVRELFWGKEPSEIANRTAKTPPHPPHSKRKAKP